MDEIKTIEPTPCAKSFTCKLLVGLVSACLYLLAYVLALLGWFWYDFFIGFCFLCFGYLLNGIIHSKLRQLSVPNDQSEISFSSYELARWFVIRYLKC